MPLPVVSPWPGRQPLRTWPRLVDGRRGDGPSSVAPRFALTALHHGIHVVFLFKLMFIIGFTLQCIKKLNCVHTTTILEFPSWKQTGSEPILFVTTSLFVIRIGPIFREMC